MTHSVNRSILCLSFQIICTYSEANFREYFERKLHIEASKIKDGSPLILHVQGRLQSMLDYFDANNRLVKCETKTVRCDQI